MWKGRRAPASSLPAFLQGSPVLPPALDDTRLGFLWLMLVPGPWGHRQFSWSSMFLWPDLVCSGTLPSSLPSILCALTVALADSPFYLSPRPGALPLSCSPLPLAAPAALCPLVLAVPPQSCTWREPFPRPVTPLPLLPLPHLLWRLHPFHFSSVFCPCGKARPSAASCPTLLHLWPPRGPLVDDGVEPVSCLPFPGWRDSPRPPPATGAPPFPCPGRLFLWWVVGSRHWEGVGC